MVFSNHREPACGLTHRIGVLLIFTYIEEHGDEEDLASDSLIDGTIAAVGPVIGEKILLAWDFPESLSIVPRQHIDLTRNVTTVDFADIVQLARLQSYGFAYELVDVPEWSAIPSFTRLGLTPNEGDGEALELEGLSEEISLSAEVLQ